MRLLIVRTDVRSQRGGVFTLLLGFLFLATLGVSGYVYYLYVQEHENLQAKEHQLRLVVAEKDGLKTELDETYQLKVRIEGELAQRVSQLEIIKVELAKTIEEKTTLAQAVDERQTEISRLSQELGQANTRAQEMTAQLATLLKEKSDALSQIAELRNENQSLEAKMTGVSSRPVVELEKVVVSSGVNETVDLAFESELFAPSSSMNSFSDVSSSNVSNSGEVIVVNREYEFVVMNLGRNDGLSIGQEFQIVRGGEILGRVKVEKVYDALSAATILPNSRQDEIREGDAVKAL